MFALGFLCGILVYALALGVLMWNVSGRLEREQRWAAEVDEIAGKL